MKALQAVQSIFPRYDVDFCDTCFCLECEQPSVFVIIRQGGSLHGFFFFSSELVNYSLYGRPRFSVCLFRCEFPCVNTVHIYTATLVSLCSVMYNNPLVPIFKYLASQL